jgi:Fe-coproporphyrin III synthase
MMSSYAGWARGVGSLATRRNRPLKLTVLVTFMCQSRCNHCDIWKFYLKGAPEKVRSELTLDDYRRLFQSVSDSLVWVEFAGGEPTMRRDFDQIINSAYDLTRISTAGFTTNGLNPDRVVGQVSNVLRHTGSKPLTVGVSVDGDETVYPLVRGVNSFRRVMSTFERLRSLATAQPGLRPHIAYTISRFNAGRFQEFYDAVSREYEVGINEISITFEHFVGFYFQSFNQIEDSGRPKFNDLLMKDIASLTRIRKAESQSSLLSPRRQFYDFYIKHIKDYVQHPASQVIPCTASRLSAFVDPYGNVQPCSMWNQVIGNIKTESFEQIWNSEKNAEARETIAGERCPNCWTPCEAQPSWLGNLPRVLVP